MEAGKGAEDLLKKIARITTWSTESQWVWRGQSDERHMLHSALFHRLLQHDGAMPDEERLREVEQGLITRATQREMGGDSSIPDSSDGRCCNITEPRRGS